MSATTALQPVDLPVPSQDRPAPHLVLAARPPRSVLARCTPCRRARTAATARLPRCSRFAALQLLWGGLALVRPSRAVAIAGALLGLGAVAGWLLAKTTGLPLVDGLQEAEPVQLADAAALAGAAAALPLLALLGRRVLPVLPGLALVCVVALAGATTTSGHEHPGATAHAEAPHTQEAPHTKGGTAHVKHAEPVPYDPALPIDLGATPGVTPQQQQASAESLVAVTLARLPRWSDATAAEQAGFRSIGDGFTGTEHLISQEFLEDDVALDPDRPESLVYDTSTGGRRLVAAMHMLKPGTPLERPRCHRWCTCGSRRTSAGRSPRWRASPAGRSPRESSGCAITRTALRAGRRCAAARARP